MFTVISVLFSIFRHPSKLACFIILVHTICQSLQILTLCDLICRLTLVSFQSSFHSRCEPLTNKHPSLFLCSRCNLLWRLVSSFVCFGCWVLALCTSCFFAQQFLNVLELIPWFRCEVPSYLGATAKEFDSYMTLICYHIFSVLGSRRGNVSVREDLLTASLGKGWNLHQICPCLM